MSRNIGTRDEIPVFFSGYLTMSELAQKYSEDYCPAQRDLAFQTGHFAVWSIPGTFVKSWSLASNPSRHRHSSGLQTGSRPRIDVLEPH